MNLHEESNGDPMEHRYTFCVGDLDWTHMTPPYKILFFKRIEHNIVFMRSRLANHVIENCKQNDVLCEMHDVWIPRLISEKIFDALSSFTDLDSPANFHVHLVIFALEQKVNRSA